MIRYSLIIIGGGPAGITAGIYAARKRLNTLLITKDFMGQVGSTSKVDNWPGTPNILGMDLIRSFEKHLRRFEIEILTDREVLKLSKVDKGYYAATKEGDQFLAKTVIAATGRTPKKLNVPGEERFRGRGVSYCFVCDGPFFKNKSVVIIGGGNSGFEAALDLARYAKRVFIFERSDSLASDELLQQQVKKTKKIQVHLNKELKKIEGAERVQDVIYQDLKTKKTFQLPIDGIFVQIGAVPEVEYLKGLVDLNKWQEVKVDPQTCATSREGVFAAGDINDIPFKQIVTAAADGCRAALSAYDYLHLPLPTVRLYK